MPTFLPALIAALAATCVSIAAAETTVIYVNASAAGANDGSSWTDAYTDLHEALAVATPGTQIWIAAGEYLGGWPGETFELVSGVALYGGFAGWEETLEERDSKLNETILHGGDLILSAVDLAEPVLLEGLIIKDGFNWTGPAGLLVINAEITIINCSFLNNTTIGRIVGGGAIGAVDATLTIFDSLFKENVSAELGGAVRSTNSMITISHCTFESNMATFNGGALRLSDGDVYIEDSTFHGNIANGGSAVQAGGTFHLTRCTFTNNGGEGYGTALIASGIIEDSIFINNEGGAELWNDAVVRGCQFIGNNAFGGGGAFIGGSGTVEVMNCLFNGNFSQSWGGGLYINSSATVTISNSQFLDNGALTFEGGGIMSVGTGVVHVIDSLFDGNWADLGGAASVRDGTLIIERCDVTGNFGGLHANRGGALNVIDSIITHNYGEGVHSGYDWGQPGHATVVNSLIANNNGSGVRLGFDYGPPSFATIINSTIVNNKINFPAWNAGVFLESGHADIRNSIIWGNKPDGADATESHQIKILDGTVDVSHSIIHMLTPGGMFDIPGANNIGDDPLFVNPNPLNDEEPDFRLQAGSPAIDAGDNAYVPDEITTDLDGNPRIIDGNDDGKAIVDLGPYEFTGETPVPPIPGDLTGDLTGDGKVGVPDLLVLLANWGPCADCTPGNCPADLTGNGTVGVPDLLILLANWG